MKPLTDEELEACLEDMEGVRKRREAEESMEEDPCYGMENLLKRVEKAVFGTYKGEKLEFFHTVNDHNYTVSIKRES